MDLSERGHSSRKAVAARATILGLAALGLYAFRIGSAPIYLKYEELYFALEAHAVATTGHDTHGRLLPIYFQVFADSWYQPVLVYLMAAFLTVLPLSEFVVRLPSAVVGSIDVILMYFIGRLLFARERFAFIAALLLMFTPAHFIESRVAMDYLYPVPFTMAWLLCLIIFVQRHKLWHLFLATLCLGIGFFSYAAALALMPMYLLMTILMVSVMHDDRMKRIGTAAAGFLLPIAASVPFLVQHPEYLAAQLGRYGPQARTALDPLQKLSEVFNYANFSSRVDLYFEFFSPGYLFLTGGSNPVDSTRRAGVFLMPLTLFLAVGIVQAVRKRSAPGVLVLLGFVTAPIAALSMLEGRAIDRETVLLPFGVLLSVVGVEWLWSAPFDYSLKRAVGMLATLSTCGIILYAAWRLASGSTFPPSVVPLLVVFLLVYITAAWSERTKRLRPVAATLLGACALQFIFFWTDYLGDYRIRTANHFGGNIRGALEEIIAQQSRGGANTCLLEHDSWTH